MTNPAIDREREIEHFSCRAVFGARPSVDRPQDDPRTIETAFPIILGGHHGMAPLSDEIYREVAKDHKTYLLEDLWECFRGRAGVIDISCLEAETAEGALERLSYEAAKKVLDGSELLVLSDRTAYEGERPWIDPHLALAAIDRALREYRVEPGEENLRRRTSLVLRSGAIRNVHDVCMALGLGADGVCPYVMVEVICVDDYRDDISKICSALRKGMEKVISTLGIHELRGYARLFSAIGLQAGAGRDLRHAGLLRLHEAGTGFAELNAGSAVRAADPGRAGGRQAGEDVPLLSQGLQGSDRGRERRRDVRGVLRQGARAGARAADLDAPHPRPQVRPRARSTPRRSTRAWAGTRYPIVISSMSFGSQGETAFRAYPEAAKRINIVCVNGEGGEIRDMYGKYPLWRGQQVASGRFGVTSEMLNSSYLVEIKIGQGAKPGEGGHLPAKKVSEKVAAARNATPGTDLISPSNNHDLYSIEDLAELIDELKTANPDVRVSVKVPGRAEHRHDRRRDREGGRRHHHAVGLRGRHGCRAPARASPRRPARRTSARARCTSRCSRPASATASRSGRTAATVTAGTS